MTSRPNDPDAVDPALLGALILANIEAGTEIARRTFPSVFSIATHSSRDLDCLKSMNPHPWSHIRRKHHRVRSRRQFTQPPDTQDVPIDTGPTHYQPLPHLRPRQQLHVPPSRQLSPISGNPEPHSHAQDSSCHVTSGHDNHEHEPATSRTRNGEGELRERLARVKQRRREAEEHARVAEEVEAPPGEYIPPTAAHVYHGDEHDNGPSPHGFVLASTTAVEPRANDTRPGEYDPLPLPPDPPPPIHGTEAPLAATEAAATAATAAATAATAAATTATATTTTAMTPPPPHPPPRARTERLEHNAATAQTPQVNPIEIRADKHDEEHDDRVVALVVTNAVELSTNGSRGAVATATTAAAAAAAATPTATATATATAAPPPHPHPYQLPRHPDPHPLVRAKPRPAATAHVDRDGTSTTRVLAGKHPLPSTPPTDRSEHDNELSARGFARANPLAVERHNDTTVRPPPPSFKETGSQTEPPPAVVNAGTHPIPILAFTDTGTQTEAPPVVKPPPQAPRAAPSRQPPTLPAPSSYGIIHDRTPHVLAMVFPYQETRNARISALVWGSDRDHRQLVLETLPPEYKVFLHILLLIAYPFPNTLEPIFGPPLVLVISQIVEDWLDFQIRQGAF